MSTYFHGWRRKIGVMTLVMACVCASVWVRSYGFQDFIGYGFGKNRVDQWGLDRTGVMWIRQDYDSEVDHPLSWDCYSSTKDRDQTVFSPLEYHKMEWHWRWIGFEFGVAKDASKDISNQNSIRVSREAFWFIPYWSIGLPLTLLSAYLLLGKPRSKPPKAT